jgi:hypothetical protein
MPDMDLREVDEIIFHHTGNEVTPQQVQNLHRRGQDDMGVVRDASAWVQGRSPPFRWDDVAYHFMIAEDGTIYDGRSARYEGNSSTLGGANRNSIAVAFLGDYTNRPLTSQQLASARALVLGLRQNSGRDNFAFTTHGDYDERKRNEVRGGWRQIQGLERRLAADRAAIAEAPERDRQALAARQLEAATREAREARRAAQSADEERLRRQRARWERYPYD